MNRRHGQFVWRELNTPSLDDSKTFYSGLFGWSFEDKVIPMGDSSFTMPLIQNGDVVIGAMIPSGGSDEHPPHWMSYVSVDDVDAAAKAAEASGGKVGVQPMDLPTGRFSVVGDPSGAWITAFCDKDGDKPPKDMPEAGDFCWETLVSKDLEAAKPFYKAVFGWDAAVGPMGSESVFNAGDVGVADFQQGNDELPSRWATYVVVDDLDAAKEKVSALGGEVLMSYVHVPTVGHIAFVADPQGAGIGLFQPESAAESAPESP